MSANAIRGTAEDERRIEAIGAQPPPAPSINDIPGGIPVTVRTRDNENSLGNDDGDGSQSAYSEFADEEEEDEEEEQYSEFEDNNKVRHSTTIIF